MKEIVEVSLREDGVLWAVNRIIFHPRGFALAVDDDGNLSLMGDGREVWLYSSEIAEDDLFLKFEALLDRGRNASGS